jgi:hypothetical protein
MGMSITSLQQSTTEIKQILVEIKAKADSELDRFEKLSESDEIAAGIAHERGKKIQRNYYDAQEEYNHLDRAVKELSKRQDRAQTMSEADFEELCVVAISEPLKQVYLHHSANSSCCIFFTVWKKLLDCETRDSPSLRRHFVPLTSPSPRVRPRPGRPSSVSGERVVPSSQPNESTFSFTLFLTTVGLHMA